MIFFPLCLVEENRIGMIFAMMNGGMSLNSLRIHLIGKVMKVGGHSPPIAWTTFATSYDLLDKGPKTLEQATSGLGSGTVPTFAGLGMGGQLLLAGRLTAGAVGEVLLDRLRIVGLLPRRWSRRTAAQDADMSNAWTQPLA